MLPVVVIDSTERLSCRTINIWTKHKTQLHISTLEILLIIKLNLDYNNLAFYELLKQSSTLLKKIVSNDKY